MLRLLLLLVFLLGACGVRVVVKPPPEPLRTEQTEAWHKEVLGLAKSGDWLILRGYHDTDNMVAAYTNHPLSHAVIIDMERQEVIEAVSKGVGLMPLRQRVHEAHRVLLVRPKWWTPERGKAAVAKARQKVGSPYDYLGTVGADDPKRFYCTELVTLVYGDHFGPNEHFPTVIEPGHMYLFGKLLYDSGSRD
jgi:hypothetical protein